MGAGPPGGVTHAHRETRISDFLCSPCGDRSEQMQQVAALVVATKAAGRSAKAVGADIAARQHEEIDRAMPLDPPVTIGHRID